ncbi:sulfate ABC transporter substrate-binding protein [Aeromicrobium sp. CF4.19]|uniref:sulfate ABC transporter substrate-binding protein n=1 Tax=Aeromicrobium sp. CF4.19 TaxID=3373082 RepID=UPI003EE64924
MSILQRIGAIGGTVVVAAVLVWGAPSASSDARTLGLVGFAVPKAGNHAAQDAFARTDAGSGSSWRESYGPSGEQSRAVAGGLPADYVHFSITPDVTRLVDAGMVHEDWDAGPSHGIVTESVVVLVVREGNPKGIAGWDDLARDDVGIVTPNPGSSGAARWNVLAAWLHVAGAGGSREEAEDFLSTVLDNVEALPGSGRDATTAFQGGTGDVLISYENEAILARENGEDVDYVVPEDTLLIENPGAVTTDASPLAQDFLDFVLTPEGQALYASTGFRPLRSVEGVAVGEVEGATDPSDPFPEPYRLATIDGDLGGWDAVDATFFDEDGIVTRLLSEAAGP